MAGSHDLGDDAHWQPPSEPELKIMQARRERSDKISKLMGHYLLKGYRMLGTCCPSCDTILMQDKQKKNYCVACSEMDSDADKDDPALSSEAARRQVEEHSARAAVDAAQDTAEDRGLSTQSSPPTGPPLQNGPSPAAGIGLSQSSCFISGGHDTVDAASWTNTSQLQGIPIRVPVDVGSSLDVVKKKMLWATQELDKSASVEGSIQLCNLIKSCSETLSTLYNLK